MKLGLFLLFFGCKSESQKLLGPFELVCKHIHKRYWIYRCENQEVVCYRNSNDGGIFCKFKRGQNEGK